MAKLQTIKPRISAAPNRKLSTGNVSERRITGRALQDRRQRLWIIDPHCVDCGKLTKYPGGFELDHDVPLHVGGPDTDQNCRIRCVHYDDQGRKAGCHEEKTRRDIQAGRGGSKV